MTENHDDEIRPSLEDEGIPDVETPTPGADSAAEVDEGMMPPRDQPIAADEFGITAKEQRERELLADRVGREQPDVFLGDDAVEAVRQAGRIVEPGSAIDDLDVVPQVEGFEAEDDVAALSPEEAAMRVQEDIPGGVTFDDDPGYIDRDRK